MQDDKSELMNFLENLRTPEAAKVIIEVIVGADDGYRALLSELFLQAAPPVGRGVRILKGPDGEIIEQPYCRSKGWVFYRNRERYAKFLVLLKQNKNPKEIAVETGTPLGTVYHWLKRMEIGRDASNDAQDGNDARSSARRGREDDLTSVPEVLTAP